VSTSRRAFLTSSTLAVLGLNMRCATNGAAAAPSKRLESAQPQSTGSPLLAKAEKPLRLLILGGTGFIGPHQVRYALARGHRVTLFNRGKTNPALFPEVEKLQGDRAVADYRSLKGRDWDAVIDNPTTLPRWVRQAAEALKGHTRQFVFISTISVYAKNDTPNADETAELATAEEPESEDVRKYYGPLKAASEREAEKAFPGRATIIRPGLIVGPGDLSDRFTYWPARIAKGGEVLAPGNPSDPVQIIDARDLAEFTIRACETETTGVYNCTGPQSRLTISELLGGVRAVMSSDASLTWVDADFLKEQGARPWVDLPVWVPPTGPSAGFAIRDIRRALAKGLTFRPLAVTAKDTLNFYNSEPEDRKSKLRAGLAPEAERRILAAWRARSKS
jgi:2'-hydroxyisoflavone reductase